MALKLPITIQLGWHEYWLPWSKKQYQQRGCPGGSDFRLLTRLLAGVLCITLLLLGTREGLMNRFVETLLGNVPDSGVPIWIVSSSHSNIGQVFEDIQNITGDVFPYREIFPNEINLPAHPIRTEQKYDNKAFFPGRAVYASNPLWTLAKNPPNEPVTCFPPKNQSDNEKLSLVVTLNKSWFVKHFDYSKYRQALEKQLPPLCLKELPSANTEKHKLLNSLQVLWLNIEIGQQLELVPFKIRWVERIPTMEKLAFLFPMKIFHILQVAGDLTQLNYYPEMQGKYEQRVVDIIIWDEKYLEKDMEKQLQAFVACTDGKMQNDLIQFSKPLPVYWIQACADEHHISYTQKWHRRLSNGTEIRHDTDWWLSLPCAILDETYRKEIVDAQDFETCNQDKKSSQLVALDMWRMFILQRALVYVEDTELTEIKNQLLDLKINEKNALYFPDNYKKSIDRFDFLTDSLEALKIPYLVIFGIVFILFILWGSIGTLIDHRRHRYGIFLSKGMTKWQIYEMVSFQMFLLSTVGIFFACLGILLVMFVLDYWLFAQVVENHRDNLDIIGTLNIFPLDKLLGNIMLVWVVGSFITIIIAAIRLWLMPLRDDTTPSELLQF